MVNRRMFLPQKMQEKKMIAVQKIMSEMSRPIADFVRQIIFEAEVKPSIYSMQFVGDGVLINLSICNGETRTIVVKSYPYKEFCELVVNERIEMELNITVRQMLLKSKDNTNITIHM